MFISATINEITREIKWDKSQVAAVDGDYAVNGFKLNCLGLDPDYNLTTGTWYAVFTDQNGTSHSNPLTVSGGVVTWEFDNNINKGGSGVIKFFLYAVTTNAAGKVLKRWDSAITDLRVAGTIDYENQEEEAARESEIDRLAGLVTTLTATAATINDVKAVLARITNSSPVVVATAADLSGLDTTKYQLAIVRADGYLYYYDGTEWQQGIKYGSYELDATLTESGKAADAAAVGAEVSAIKEDLSDKVSTVNGVSPDASGNVTVEGWSDEIKALVLNCLANVAWTNTSGQSHYNALLTALDPKAYPVSIEAVYTQSRSVYTFTPLDNLKNDLVVTATMSDGTTSPVGSEFYALSGTLTIGESVVTVEYNNKKTTFSVNVSEGTEISVTNALTRVVTSNASTAVAGGTAYSATLTASANNSIIYVRVMMGESDITASVYSDGTINIPNVYDDIKILAFGGYSGASVPSEYTEYDYITALNHGEHIKSEQFIVTYPNRNLNAYGYSFLYRTTTVESSGGTPIFGGRSGNGRDYSFAVYSESDALNLWWHGNSSLHISASTGVVHSVNCLYSAESPSQVILDGSSYDVIWNNNYECNIRLGLFNNPISNVVEGFSYVGYNELGRLTLYDANGDVAADWRPVVRNADSVIGYFDTIGQVFRTCSNVSYATQDGENSLYAVGNWRQ